MNLKIIQNFIPLPNYIFENLQFYPKIQNLKVSHILSNFKFGSSPKLADPPHKDLYLIQISFSVDSGFRVRTNWPCVYEK